LPGKAHKYGIKVFKLCDGAGYTYNMAVYKGKNDRAVTSQDKENRSVTSRFLNEDGVDAICIYGKRYRVTE